MRRFVRLTLLVTAVASPLAAQSLGEVAARTNKDRKGAPAKVFTNDDLDAARSAPESQGKVSTPGAPAPSGPATAPARAPAPTMDPAERWRRDAKQRRDAIARGEAKVAAIQAKIDALMLDRDPVNVMDPNRLQTLEAVKAQALQDLETATAELSQARQAMDDLEEEARETGSLRAGFASPDARAVSPSDPPPVADVLSWRTRSPCAPCCARPSRPAATAWRRRATPTRRGGEIQASRFLVVLTDLRLPAGSGFDVLHAALEADPATPVIVMTAFGTVEEAVKAMKEGAADFLTKPVDTDHLLLLLDRAIDRRRLVTDYVLLKEEYQRRFGLPRVLGEDPALKETMLAIQRAAGTDTTVLILGESGTGKELMSRALHQLSPRAKGPFVAINCAAIPEALLENELFGHEKGAFTGAPRPQGGQGRDGPPRDALPGRDRGPAAAAAGQDPAPRPGEAVRARGREPDPDRRHPRGGGHQPRPAGGGGRARSSARTSSSASRSFRWRSRPCAGAAADIPILADAFLERFAKEMGRKGLRAGRRGAPRAHGALRGPGNVRELQNCLERAAILCDGLEIRPEHLRLARGRRARALAGRRGRPLRSPGRGGGARRRPGGGGGDQARALARRTANRAAAAERLGISVSTLARRLKAASGPE